MAEKKMYKLVPYEVGYICDRCGKGEMKPKESEYGMTLTLSSNPPLIPHKCTNCGEVIDLPERYPAIRYEREEIKEKPEKFLIDGKEIMVVSIDKANGDKVTMTTKLYV